MNFIYGHFKLDMTCDEFGRHVEKTKDLKLKEVENTISGSFPSYDFDEYREQLPADLQILTTPTTGMGVGLVGISYRNLFEFYRMYMVADKDNIVLFMDATPDTLEKIGLRFDAKTNKVHDPLNGDKVVLDLSEHVR